MWVRQETLLRNFIFKVILFIIQTPESKREQIAPISIRTWQIDKIQLQLQLQITNSNWHNKIVKVYSPVWCSAYSVQCSMFTAKYHCPSKQLNEFLINDGKSKESVHKSLKRLSKNFVFVKHMKTNTETFSRKNWLLWVWFNSELIVFNVIFNLCWFHKAEEQTANHIQLIFFLKKIYKQMSIVGG